jgi:hypothetical protein
MQSPRSLAGSQAEAGAAGNTQPSAAHPLLNFLHMRANIDRDAFHPPFRFVVLLTILASLIGLLLAVYVLLTV